MTAGSRHSSESRSAVPCKLRPGPSAKSPNVPGG